MSAASKPRARQRRSSAGSRTPDSAMTMRSSGMLVRSISAVVVSTTRVRRSRLLTPMRRASVVSAASSSRASWTSTSGSRPRSRARRTRRASRAAGWSRGQQQHRVRACRPQDGQLPRIDHEFLGQDRDRGGGTRGDQIVDGAPEPVGLDQHRDHRRAARGVGACPIGDIHAVPRRVTPADGERRLISAMTWRPGRARRSATGRGSGAAAAARPSSRSVVPASSTLRSARRRSAISWSTDRPRARRTGRSTVVLTAAPRSGRGSTPAPGVGPAGPLRRRSGWSRWPARRPGGWCPRGPRRRARRPR